MSTVSNLVALQYSVRKTVSTRGASLGGGSYSPDFSSDFDVASSGSDTGLYYDVRSRVSDTFSLKHSIRKTVSPAKVFVLRHGVRKSVHRNESVSYGVRVPVSQAKSAVVVYGVRSRVTNTFIVQYNTGANTSSVVQKAFSISYATLVTSSASKITATPIEVDSVPPQLVVTTSF